jgi:hypothetical protein
MSKYKKIVLKIVHNSIKLHYLNRHTLSKPFYGPISIHFTQTCVFVAHVAACRHCIQVYPFLWHVCRFVGVY